MKKEEELMDKNEAIQIATRLFQAKIMLRYGLPSVKIEDTEVCLKYFLGKERVLKMKYLSEKEHPTLEEFNKATIENKPLLELAKSIKLSTEDLKRFKVYLYTFCY